MFLHSHNKNIYGHKLSKLRDAACCQAGAFSTYTDYRAALTTVLKKQLGVTLVVAVVVVVEQLVAVFSVAQGGRHEGAHRSRARFKGRRAATATSSAVALLPGDETCRCRGTGHVTQHLEAPARREEAAMQTRKRDSLPSLGNELGRGTSGRRRRRDCSVDKFRRLTLPRFYTRRSSMEWIPVPLARTHIVKVPYIGAFANVINSNWVPHHEGLPAIWNVWIRCRVYCDDFNRKDYFRIFGKNTFIVKYGAV